jgi:hypothetical protein
LQPGYGQYQPQTYPQTQYHGGVLQPLPHQQPGLHGMAQQPPTLTPQQLQQKQQQQQAQDAQFAGLFSNLLNDKYVFFLIFFCAISLSLSSF